MSFRCGLGDVRSETNWENLNKTWDEDNVAYVLEDAQGLTVREYNILRRLAIKCHKTNCVLVIACLSLLDNGLHDLTDLADEVVFTNDPHNEICLGNLLKDLGVREEVIVNHLGMLRKLENASFLVVQMQSEQLYISNRQENTVQFHGIFEKSTDTAERSEEGSVSKHELLAASSHEDPAKDTSWLVGVVADMVGANRIKKKYMMELPGNQNQETLHCDLLEYARTVNDRQAEPSMTVRRAHRRLLKNRLYPRTLVLNGKLQKYEEEKCRSANPASKNGVNKDEDQWWLEI